MISANIRCLIRMEYDINSKKIPKYKVTKFTGFYQPMGKLKDTKGNIFMYLQEKLKEGENVPAMRLQAKDSLNFTGLKEYFINGKLSGYAYGNPLASKTYSAKKKENPFYEYREDGFLFIIHHDKEAKNPLIPSVIEIIVLEDARVVASAYLKQLIMGGFEEELTLLRKQAKPIQDIDLSL